MAHASYSCLVVWRELTRVGRHACPAPVVAVVEESGLDLELEHAGLGVRHGRQVGVRGQVVDALQQLHLQTRLEHADLRTVCTFEEKADRHKKRTTHSARRAREEREAGPHDSSLLTSTQCSRKKSEDTFAIFSKPSKSGSGGPDSPVSLFTPYNVCTATPLPPAAAM